MRTLSWTMFSVAFVLVGCAHSAMRGTVAMKIDDQIGHICMGDNEVKAGDKVALFVNRCRSRGNRDQDVDICEKVKIGGGEIVRTLNQHYSVLKAAPGVLLEEGVIVEKL